jgi:NADH-quinone oxidoreductase subunit L
VDAFYNRCFVKPALFLGTFFWKNVDKDLIDTFGPDGVAKTVGILSKRNSKIQTGYTFHYALAMILALMAVIGIYIFLFSKHTLFRG